MAYLYMIGSVSIPNTGNLGTRFFESKTPGQHVGFNLIHLARAVKPNLRPTNLGQLGLGHGKLLFLPQQPD